jgi:hypothetical protein
VPSRKGADDDQDVDCDERGHAAGDMKPCMLKSLATMALCAAGSIHAAETAVMSPIPWDAQGQFLEELQVPDQGVVEACEKLTAGAKVHWRYAADAPLDFNVHYHKGKKVTMPVRKDRTAKAEALFKAATAQEYCWMWSNKSGAPVWLTLQLQRQ